MNTDRRIICLALVIASFFATARADSVRVTWQASPSCGVIGYRVYYGTNSGVYPFVVNAGTNCEKTLELPRRGRWFFAATAYDRDGIESSFSNEAEWEARPQPPLIQGQTWVRVTPVIEHSTNLLNWESVAGEPTWFCATNRQEFFATRRLSLERVTRLDGVADTGSGAAQP